jgi:hypothetical protein
MRRLAAVGVLIGLAGVLGALPAQAHARTRTFTVKDQTQSFVPPTHAPGFPGGPHHVQCGDVRDDARLRGGYHETGTATGTFAFAPRDPSQPSYTGQFTM